jgi:hypothetical protein
MTNNLYVGNLSYDTNEDTLRTLFAEYGEIESVNLITDRYTGRSGLCLRRDVDGGSCPAGHEWFEWQAG